MHCHCMLLNPFFFHLNDHDIFFKQISNMLYFSESCAEVKIHHEPSNFVKKEKVIQKLPVLYPSMFNFLLDFVTRSCHSV